MDGWTKISTYNTAFDAELQHTLLAENDIKAVVINEKDSSFLIGEVDLYVEEENVDKALALLNEIENETDEEREQLLATVNPEEIE